MASQNENDFSDLESFSYFISHKGPILVATLKGLCEDDAVVQLQQCKMEIETLISESVQGVVLNLSGLTSIANDLVPVWAQLQGMVRAHRVELRICGLEEQIKEKLTKMGIIRLTELSTTLKEALPEIVTAMKKNSFSKAANSTHKKSA